MIFNYVLVKIRTKIGISKSKINTKLILKDIFGLNYLIIPIMTIAALQK